MIKAALISGGIELQVVSYYSTYRAYVSFTILFILCISSQAKTLITKKPRIHFEQNAHVGGGGGRVEKQLSFVGAQCRNEGLLWHGNGTNVLHALLAFFLLF